MNSTPGFVIGTFGSDDATDGHEHSVTYFVSKLNILVLKRTNK